MRVTENDNVVCFDVDDTLVMWSWPEEFNSQVVTFNNFGFPANLVPHQKHIELLKQFKARGHYVIVWSQGGWEWAQEVVRLLGLEGSVDEVKTKPKWIVDDLPASAWVKRSWMDLLGNRLASKDDEIMFGEGDE